MDSYFCKREIFKYFCFSRIKIYKDGYIEDIIVDELFQWCNSVYGNEVWTFQKDGTTSHTAQVTQQWCGL